MLECVAWPLLPQAARDQLRTLMDTRHPVDHVKSCRGGREAASGQNGVAIGTGRTADKDQKWGQLGAVMATVAHTEIKAPTQPQSTFLDPHKSCKSNIAGAGPNRPIRGLPHSKGTNVPCPKKPSGI